MKKVLLDTSFILSCVRKKIDFFEEIKNLGIEIIIPLGVIREISCLSNSKYEASVALKLLEKNIFSEISLKGGNVDKSIINYVNKNHLIIGSLDNEIMEKTKGSKMIIRGKQLEIVG